MINIAPYSFDLLLRFFGLILTDSVGMVGEEPIFCRGTQKYFWARKSCAACEVSKNYGKCYIPQQ